MFGLLLFQKHIHAQPLPSPVAIKLTPSHSRSNPKTPPYLLNDFWECRQNCSNGQKHWQRHRARHHLLEQLHMPFIPGVEPLKHREARWRTSSYQNSGMLRRSGYRPKLDDREAVVFQITEAHIELNNVMF